MQSDAYQTTGCYNLLCSGFVQTNSKIAMGAAISPTSSTDGSQLDIGIMIWKVYSILKPSTNIFDRLFIFYMRWSHTSTWYQSQTYSSSLFTDVLSPPTTSSCPECEGEGGHRCPVYTL